MEEMESYLIGVEFQICKRKKPQDGLHNNVKALNTTEPYVFSFFQFLTSS